MIDFLHLLFRSVIHEQGEAYDRSGCITSTLNVAKGNKKPLDLYLAETKAEDGVQQNVGFLHICELIYIIDFYLYGVSSGEVQCIYTRRVNLDSLENRIHRRGKEI